jgi:hypothetical protein
MMEWINVADRLPEDKTIVMTYGVGCADSEYCQAYFHYFNAKPSWQELDCCGDFLEMPPSHWQSLPEPPKHNT